MTVNGPFAECDVAELHRADSIQSFGAMVVLDEDDGVVAASANLAAFVGVEPQAVLGTDARASLPAALWPSAIRAEAPVTTDDASVRLHLRPVTVAGRQLSLAAHARAGYLLLEVQVPGAGDVDLGDAASVVQRLTDRLEGTDEPGAVASVLMDAIADLTGFDRTMVYRFLPDWHGEVLDERLAAGMDGYRGLRFPAGDIPANARRLYRLKRQRIIADARAAPVPVFGAREGMTLDLTGSELRAVHPVHLEYLANMGVVASFSVSIVTRGELWGMIACHHRTPRALGFVTRQACEMAATIASLHIANLERASHLRDADRLRADLDRIWFEVERDDRLDMRTVLPRLRRVFAADGAVARWDGATYGDGDLPATATLERLREIDEGVDQDAVRAASSVPAELAADPEAVRTASGRLHLSLGRDASLTLLRREQVENVDWAGRPTEDAPREERLGPRSSFALWREATRGQATAWSAAAVEAADALREHLLEERDRLVLERRASSDPLTGLANRAAFAEAIGELLGSVRTHDVALLLIDLDGFKQVNDTLGHVAGDRLLVEVADRLRRVTRDADLTARFGGDEFAVVMHGVVGIDALRAAAERIVTALAAPYRLDQDDVTVTASVGGAFGVADESADSLTERADAALYAAKDAGRNRFVLADR